MKMDKQRRRPERRWFTVQDQAQSPTCVPKRVNPNLRLRQKLERAELIIEAQKKLCTALGLPIAEETSEHN